MSEAASAVAKVDRLHGRRLAIATFRMGDETTTQLGLYITDLFESALAGQPGTQVMKRATLCQAMRQRKVALKEQLDPQAARKSGVLGPSDFLVLGRVVTLDDTALVTVRILELESGRAVFTRSINIPMTDALAQKGEAQVANGGCG